MADNKNLDRAKLVIQRKKDSLSWMETNFWGEWEETWKHYKARRDEELDPLGKKDPDQAHIGSPLTWGHAQRTVARGTAQPPNLRFHCKDEELSELISRTLMYQWDRARIQRQQKKHFRQALLFGWSPRPWYWDVDEHLRSKRVDVMGGPVDDATLEQIAATYNLPLEKLKADPLLTQRVLARLLKNHSRGRLLPIKYRYKSYEGPNCDFLFLGDAYPEPNFQSLQSSNWFIVERRRNREWINKVIQGFPEFKPGFEELLEKHPKGTQRRFSADQTSLRNRMLGVTEKTDETDISEDDRVNEWTISRLASLTLPRMTCGSGRSRTRMTLTAASRLLSAFSLTTC
jgi:hypothetical protein